MASISFKSVEKFDYISLLKILQNWDHINIPYGGKDSWFINNTVFVPKTIITNYLKKAILSKNSNIGEIPVTYKYSEIRKKQGRLFAFKGLSLQSFNKWFRHTICKASYIDVAVENCHPVILLQYCQKNQISCTELLKYVQNRDQYLSDLQTKHNYSRFDAKQCILAVLNGAKRYSPVKWFDSFKKEITNIHQSISNNPCNCAIVELIKKTKTKTNGYNIQGRITNHILCQLENDVLLTCIKYLQENNYPTKNIVLCFDGFMIPIETLKPTEEFFDKLSDYVNKEIGYNLNFTMKAMDHILDLESFECNVDGFKLQNNAIDKCIIVDNEKVAAEILLQHLEGKIIKSQDHIYIKTQRYQTWISDPHQVDDELNLQCMRLELMKTKDSGKLSPFSHNAYPRSQIIKTTKLIVPSDDKFADKLFHQSIHKMFFLDGVYDFTQYNSETKKYGIFRKETDKDITPVRLNKNFPQRNQIDIDRVNDVLNSIFTDENTKITFLQHLARSTGGQYSDKSWSVLVGSRNSGKGVITDALLAAFGEYMTTFDANNLIYKKGLGCDEAKAKSWLLALRWVRLAFGNEINISNGGEDSTAKLNGIILKSIVSGGDYQIAREIYHRPIKFQFGGRLFLCVNEIPQIVPKDACETMTLFTVTNKFVDSVNDLSAAELKFMKLKDPNLKQEIRTKEFSDALIHIIFDNYIETKVIDCDSVRRNTNEHRVDQGDDYLFLKETFDITYIKCDKISSAEIQKIIKFKGIYISPQRIKQILVNQYNLDQDKNIAYGNSKCTGYRGIKLKDSIKKDMMTNNEKTIQPSKIVMNLKSINTIKIKNSDITINNDPPPPAKEDKKKRKTIPKIVREKVWKTYINNLESKCLVCNDKQITAFDFECGHVDANGEATVSNLRPICRLCNSSMGRENMKTFAEKYFPQAKVLFTFN